MRTLDLISDGGFRPDAPSIVLSRMIYPEQERDAVALLSHLRLEAELREESGEPAQSAALRAIEEDLRKYETIGRMAGDVAVKMVMDHVRGQRTSLEYASSFVSEYYASEETPDERYPTDTKRLQETVRRLKPSLHLWGAWQLCQEERENFDFLRSYEDLHALLLTASLLQEAMHKIAYFQDWSPWMVPRRDIEAIRPGRSGFHVLEETDFERAFATSYKSKIGRA